MKLGALQCWRLYELEDFNFKIFLQSIRGLSISVCFWLYVCISCMCIYELYMQLGCRAYTIKLGFVHCPGPAHCDRGAAKVQLQLQDRDIAPDQSQWKASLSAVKSRAECESSEKLCSEQPWKAVHQWKAARKDCLCRCRPDNVWSGQCGYKCVEHILHCLHCVCFCACVLALYVLVQTCTVCVGRLAAVTICLGMIRAVTLQVRARQSHRHSHTDK